MLGEIGLPGRGVSFGYGSMGNRGDPRPVISSPGFKSGPNPLGRFIPVARVADMLLDPGGRIHFDGEEITYPDIDIVWWAGGNPFHHHQDLNRLIRAWKKPETIISHEWCWNALAKRSDIVLPCTTPLEREDIALTPRDPYVVHMSKLTEPFAESRDDFEIFRNLAQLMDVEKDFTEGRSASETLSDIGGTSATDAANEATARRQTAHRFPRRLPNTPKGGQVAAAHNAPT